MQHKPFGGRAPPRARPAGRAYSVLPYPSWIKGWAPGRGGGKGKGKKGEGRRKGEKEKERGREGGGKKEKRRREWRGRRGRVFASVKINLWV